MHLSRFAKIAIATTLLTAAGAIYMDKAFLTFLVAWIIVIPIVACGYAIYGLIQYRKNTKNSIIVSVKSNNLTERYAELIRKEEEIRKEKEALYKELKNGKQTIK